MSKGTQKFENSALNLPSVLAATLRNLGLCKGTGKFSPEYLSNEQVYEPQLLDDLRAIMKSVGKNFSILLTKFCCKGETQNTVVFLSISDVQTGSAGLHW